MREKTQLLHFYGNIWSKSDKQRVDSFFKAMDSKFNDKAAIGLGAGGIGIENIIEVLISGLTVNMMYDISKSLALKLWSIRPKKKRIPSSLKREVKQIPYELILHINNDTYNKTLIINLNSSYNDLESALDKLGDEFLKHPDATRHYQTGNKWDRY